MAIVKANGYGHGAVPVAKAALHQGAQWLGLGSVEEAIYLRQAGITAPMLVLGPPLKWQASLAVENDLRVTVCTWDVARELSHAAKLRGVPVRVHVKIDTGMGRLGVMPGAALDFIKRLQTLPNLEVEGIFSHFATADSPDHSYAQQQFSAFMEVIHDLEQAEIDIPIKHMANTAAALALPKTQLSLVRSGIAVYGLSTVEDPQGLLDLVPALELKVTVSFVHRVLAGSGVSYDAKYVVSEDTNIVTLPVGYADGYSRLLSGKGEVLLQGKRYPLVGNICMGQCMADVGDDAISVGDVAVLMGRQGHEYISAADLAAKMGTIHYEVICMMGDKLPRFYRGQEARRQGLLPGGIH
jgi:alanine racemase